MVYAGTVPRENIADYLLDFDRLGGQTAFA